MERYLAIFLGVLILGSLSAFLLYVPVLPLAVVVALLLSLVLQIRICAFAAGELWCSSAFCMQGKKAGSFFPACLLPALSGNCSMTWLKGPGVK